LDVRGEPFWNHLSAAGRRVAILDVPKTYPSDQIRGIQVVDWGTHDPDLGFSTSPPSLAAEIEARFGAHPVRQCDEYMSAARSGFASLRDDLIRGVETKARLAGHYLDQGGWDLFLTVFAESHCVGHQCWHLRDPSHPRHDAAAARAVGDPVRDVYAAIDAALGRLIARAGPETTVFVLASHGMGPHYDGTFLLDEMLQRLFSRPEAPRSARALARAAERIWHRIPPRLQDLTRPIRNRVKDGLGHAVRVPDLASRVCFSTPNNDVYGGIRVNVAGREPRGSIRPGEEYDAFCETLTRDLLTFVNLETGRPLVRRVLRSADLYPGARLSDLPDLLVEWDRDAPIRRISSPKTGVIEGVFPGRRTGDHKPEGLFFAFGPGIVPGAIEEVVPITAFAPTIAALLEAPFPPNESGVIGVLRPATASGRAAL